ncbi:MAG: hypothetical protein JNK43_07640 [Ignavibacteria bacterium]|nr:hypothetical protein [Ignavibacteria bacterium]
MKLLSTLLITALIVSSVMFTSCGKKDDVKTKDTQKKDSTSQTKQDPNNKLSTNPDSSQKNMSADIRNISYEPGKLPASVKYDGKIVGGARWEDKNGVNVVIVTETEEKTTGDNRSKELFGYQFILDGENAKQVWKINDFIKDCPVDVMLSLIPKSLTVTDINRNGIGESTFLYRMSCKGDVSPDDMKLIMHEGEAKYPIRGSMIQIMGGEKYGGEMKVDAAFDKAPSGFFAYAQEQWKKFETEKIGE